MRSRSLIMAVLAVLAFAAPVRAQETLPDMTCTFELGNAWTVENGKLKASTPKPLSFNVKTINLDAQTAQQSSAGQTGTTPLRIIRALNANHFLEVAQEGFLNLTTIYDRDPASGTHPAVHSRHFALLGQPLFSQYAGTCKEQ